MTPDQGRLRRIRWCECGQPWIPAVGLYGTTEETECCACVLRRLLGEAKAAAAAAPRQVAVKAVAICQGYACQYPEHARAASAIAVRIAHDVRKGAW